MNAQRLFETASALVSGDKGLLAMDESIQTCNKRFQAAGIAQTQENRRAWRELILTTPSLNEHIGGVILYDETIRQHNQAGTLFIKTICDAGMIPGIKVDTGAKAMAAHANEKITEGLDGLRERLYEYAHMGARFAKWRAVIQIGANTPTQACIEANASALARYASVCQELQLVPIIEPEVLMDGTSTLTQCAVVTQRVLRAVFNQLYIQDVVLEGLILKPNMVLGGQHRVEPVTIEQVAHATLTCLLRSVPAAVPAIAFLSGGQPAELACARLNAMNVLSKHPLPWALTFSFSRAILQPALEIWQGKPMHQIDAQKSIFHRAKCSRAARRGEYSAALELRS
jgi:fructose-bisphosphate aldolase, class I